MNTTMVPTFGPTSAPTMNPTLEPTLNPTSSPTDVPIISQSNTGIIIDTLSFYGSIYACSVFLYIVVRWKYPKLFNIRSWVPEHFSTIAYDMKYSGINWYYKVFTIPTELDIYENCGMDTLCFLRALRFGRYLSILGCCNAIYLIPLYYTAPNTDSTAYITDKFMQMTVSNLPSSSKRFIAPVVAAYILNLYAMYFIYHEFRWYTKWRHYFLSRKTPRNYACYVSGIPTEYQSSYQLLQYFQQCAANNDTVVEAHIVMDTPKLDKLVSRRDIVVKNLEHAIQIERHHYKTDHVQKHHSIHSIYGSGKLSRVESVRTYETELQQLNQTIESAVHEIMIVNDPYRNYLIKNKQKPSRNLFYTVSPRQSVDIDFEDIEDFMDDTMMNRRELWHNHDETILRDPLLRGVNHNTTMTQQDNVLMIPTEEIQHRSNTMNLINGGIIDQVNTGDSNTLDQHIIHHTINSDHNNNTTMTKTLSTGLLLLEEIPEVDSESIIESEPTPTTSFNSSYDAFHQRPSLSSSPPPQKNTRVSSVSSDDTSSVESVTGNILVTNENEKGDQEHEGNNGKSSTASTSISPKQRPTMTDSTQVIKQLTATTSANTSKSSVSTEYENMNTAPSSSMKNDRTLAVNNIDNSSHSPGSSTRSSICRQSIRQFASDKTKKMKLKTIALSTTASVSIANSSRVASQSIVDISRKTGSTIVKVSKDAVSTSEQIGKQTTNLTKTVGTHLITTAGAVVPILLTQSDGKAKDAGFVIFSNLYSTQCAVQMIHHTTPYVMDVIAAPDPHDVFWRNVGLPHRALRGGRIASYTATTILCFFWTVPMSAISSLTEVKSLKESLPRLGEFIEEHPSFEKMAAMLAPLLILFFNEIMLPHILKYFATWEGHVSASMLEASLFLKLGIFNIIQTFFVSAFAGSISSELTNILNDPSEVITLLANSLPAQSSYFIQITLGSTFLWQSFEIMRIYQLSMAFLRKRFGPNLTPKEKQERWWWLRPIEDPPGFWHGETFAQLVLFYMVTFVYQPIAPIASVFLLFCFLLIESGYRYQLIHNYPVEYDTGGQLWRYWIRFTLVSMVVAQLTLIGALVLKQSTYAGPALGPLLAITILFILYINAKHAVICEYLPTRECIIIDNERNETDDGGVLDMSFAINAYLQPSLKGNVVVPNLDEGVCYYTNHEDAVVEDGASESSRKENCSNHNNESDHLN